MMTEDELNELAAAMQRRTGYRFLECVFAIAFDRQAELDPDLYAQLQLEFEDYDAKMEAAGLPTFVDLRPKKTEEGTNGKP